MAQKKPAKAKASKKHEAPIVLQASDLDISTVLRKAWAHFLEHSGLMLGLAVLSALPGVIIGLVAASNQSSTEVLGLDLSESGSSVPFSNPTEFAIFAAAVFAASIVSLVVSIMIMRAALHTLKAKQQITLTEAWSLTAPVLVPAIVISIIVSVIIASGLILFIVPGIVFALWYMYVVLVQIDQPSRNKRATLRRSKQLYRANRGLPIFWGLTMIGLIFGFVIASFPIIFLIELLPLLGNFVGDVLYSALSIYAMVGFVIIYLHMSQVVPDDDSLEADIAARSSD